jgi:hypothetical protein
MFAEAVGLGVARVDIEWAHRRAQIFRLAFGMTLSAGIALGLAWPLSFITPVLTAKLLIRPRVMPVKAAVAFVVLLGGSVLLSATILLPMLRYPAVHVLLTGLILFLLFYAKAGGVNPLLVVLSLIAALVIPLVGTVSLALAEAVAWGLTFATVVAVIMVYVSAAAFPDPPAVGRTIRWSDPGTRDGGKKGPVDVATPAPRARAALALRSWIVLYPLAVTMQLYSLEEYAVVLIMATLLAVEPDFGQHLAKGKGLLLANLAGGLVAVVIFNFLVSVPSFTFFLLLVLLAGLWSGGQIFSAKPLGKLLAGGITAVFLILGPVVTGEAEAGGELYTRVVMIMGAVAYVVLAFGLLERLTRGTRLGTL